MRSLRWLLLALAMMPITQNPELLDSSPQPGEVLTYSPAEVSLLLDRPFTLEQVQIHVIDVASGGRVDNADMTVDGANPNRFSVTLPTLPEGSYVVEYEIVIDPATTVTSSFTFMVIAPPPQLLLLAPANGAVLPGGELTLEMSIDSFALTDEDNAILLTIDGVEEASFSDTSYTLDGLAPGVHQVEVVLAHNGEALEATRAEVIVAVPQPDPEAEGWQAARTAPPDPGLQLQTWQVIAVVAVGLSAFGVGIWLGRKPGGDGATDDR
jgi:methionine-rich copper-binding protein CopC